MPEVGVWSSHQAPLGSIYNEKNHEDHANKYETKASVIHVKYILHARIIACARNGVAQHFPCL